jgi:amidase
VAVSAETGATDETPSTTLPTSPSDPLDAVVVPAVADVGRADADVDERSAEAAWRNGVWVANGNLVPRHLGIRRSPSRWGPWPTPGCPSGLTIAGRGWTDTDLLHLAAAVEATRPRRTVPPRTPPLT